MLEDKTAIVTGGAQGIGRAIAFTFHEHGADVVVADVKREGPEEDVPTDELVDGEYVETDVSDPDSVRDLVDGVAEKQGLDIIVNNAGVTPQGKATEISVEDWLAVIDVNLNGVFYGCKFALAHLIEREGCIINISSIAGIQATSSGPGYSASKAGVANLTRQLALDYAEHNVRVNAIAPGPTETEIFRSSARSEEVNTDQMSELIPQKRIAQPSDMANAALFLASDLADYVNGHNLVVDGALSAKYY